MKALAVLIEATCYDPVTSSPKTVRVCNRNEPRVTTFNDQEWRPILTKSPAVGLSVFNGDFSGFGVNTIDGFAIAATEKDLDALAAYVWHGSVVKIYAGDVSTGDFPLVFTAVGAGITRRSNEVILVELETRNKLLADRQLLYLSYAGTGGIEGIADLKGVLKPMVFGHARYCQPVLIDEVRQIYQVHGYGPVESIDGVFEGGLAVGTGGLPAASHSGTYAAFRDAAIGVGEWHRHNNLGLIKLGSQPTFPITCHVKGDTNGVAAGTALVKAADIVKRMVTMNVAGVSLSNASIAALNAAAAQPIDMYFDVQVSVLDAVALALRSVGAYWFWDAEGVVRLGRMRLSSSPTLVTSDLELLVNGDGDDTAGWGFFYNFDGAHTSVGGRHRITATGAGQLPHRGQNFATVPGNTYRLRAEMYPHEGNKAKIWRMNAEGSGVVEYDYATFGGVLDVTFVAGSTGTTIIMWAADSTGVSNGEYAEFDNLSVVPKVPLALSAKGDFMPEVINVNQLATSAPVWSLRFGAEVCHFVHDASSVPGILLDLQEDTAPFNPATNTIFPPGTTPPVGAIDGDVWPDTSLSATQPTLRRYDGDTATWVTASSAYVAAIGVNVYNPQAANPDNPPTQAQLITSLGTAAAITGQGALATKSSVNLASTEVTNKVLDNLSDGTYAKPLATELSSGVIKLAVPGSGYKVGDSRNLPNIIMANLQYKFTGTVSYTSAAGTPATATISVTAGSVYSGIQVSYNAMNVNVSGTGGTSVQYFLYVDDPTNAGGAQTLVATTTALDIYSSSGRVYIGEVLVVYPTSGTGGGGGSGGGGPCVWADAWVEVHPCTPPKGRAIRWVDGRAYLQARFVRSRDRLRVLRSDREGTMWYPCVGNSVHPNVPGWLIEAPSGRRVTVSNTAPITLRDGTVIGVNELDGHELPTCAGEMGWEGPCLARPAGLIEVARILVNQHTYAAGDDPEVGMVLTHNPKP